MGPILWGLQKKTKKFLSKIEILVEDRTAKSVRVRPYKSISFRKISYQKILIPRYRM